MKSNTKIRHEERCLEYTDETEMSASERAKAEVTAHGKYRCRYCGMLFETLEAHDRHRRKVHGQVQSYLSATNQS